MPKTFQTAADLADWLPDAPPFAEGDDAWLSMDFARAATRLSESGLAKLRRRLSHKYEHRDPSGRVFFYGPFWLRLWAVAKDERPSGVRV